MKNTIIRVSKNKIKEAIKKEPLKGANWIDLDTAGFKTIKKTSRCHVCAVGAVLRNVLDENQNAEMINKAAGAACRGSDYMNLTLEEAEKLASRGRYMNALSGFFENLYDAAESRAYQQHKTLNVSRHQIYRIRKRLLKFVDKHFPNSILININGAKPKRRIKVVK